MEKVEILLVEDDQDDIELLMEAFANAGFDFHIIPLDQGDQVIPFLETRTKLPNLVILDLNLPKIHGRQILQLLKHSSRFSNIPVVVLTTSSSEEEKQKSLRDGARLFLTKPSTVQGLDEAVKQIVSIIAVQFEEAERKSR